MWATTSRSVRRFREWREQLQRCPRCPRRKSQPSTNNQFKCAVYWHRLVIIFSIHRIISWLRHVEVAYPWRALSLWSNKTIKKRAPIYLIVPPNVHITFTTLGLVDGQLLQDVCAIYIRNMRTF